MKFRPCIDIHQGEVKQIVGSTLSDEDASRLKTNFTASEGPAWFAELYRRDNLRGGHIIKLGPGNDEAARQALAAWPGGMQIGGGITAENGSEWLEYGASHVIVTSYVFRDGRVDEQRLGKLVAEVGRERLVLDLSCRKKGDSYYIVTDRWQNFSDVKVDADSLSWFAEHCDEILIHAADVEGQCNGIEEDLVGLLGEWCNVPITYAGGVRNMDDLETIRKLGAGKIDVSIGSALDIFGGDKLTYKEVVQFHQQHL